MAEYFKKQHSHVLESIRKLLEDKGVFDRSNFRLVNYSDAKGESRSMYEMDRDGYTLLAMGFSGKKAMVFIQDILTGGKSIRL